MAYEKDVDKKFVCCPALLLSGRLRGLRQLGKGYGRGSALRCGGKGIL